MTGWLRFRRLRQFRSHLKPAAICRHHCNRRAGTLGVRDDILVDQWKSLMQLDGGVTLVDSLSADLPDQAFDRLGLDVQVGEFGQIT